MMAEARKMMDSPEFKKQMKEFEKSKEFKEATKKTKKMMEDPQTAARMAAQMEHMVNTHLTLFGNQSRFSIMSMLTFYKLFVILLDHHPPSTF